MTRRRAYADTPFGQVHYAEEGAGTAIVMLHQAPRSLDEFAEVQRELVPEFRTIAVDMPGFGASYHVPAPQTIESMSRGVIALLDSLNIENAVLLGHHTGAAVALDVAATEPERVGVLALSSMPWLGPERRARDHSVGLDIVERREDGSHLMKLWSLRQPHYPAGRPDLLDRFMHDALVPGLDPAEGHRACDRYVMEERIGLVRCPTLVLTGGADPFAAPAVPHILDGLTGAACVEQVTIDTAMIPAMEQRPETVAHHVREFVNRVRAR
ncbi:alpha/beta fold hydrolase [Microbacterium sp. MPKO10]|uniref:alpha/beta fold hydrolase n=1 Tax=Microbacterium sp. MPKO10 TaxID=2989818 RepID=UPI0022356B38|nr:alpha/beta hydrolase [Microbacterium sp. MPKO10]MCW4459861.1 alpha/beta fold hydrolase [Microbacterium sp. MPKO10]